MLDDDDGSLSIHLTVPKECEACGRTHVAGEQFTVLQAITFGQEPFHITVPWAHDSCLN